MKKKKSLSVLIPAYNEDRNIYKLLVTLLSQNQKNWFLSRILVVCDGSKDKTAQEVLRLKSRKIKLIRHDARKGKPFRINEGFKILNSDIVLTIDADVVIKSKDVLNKIVDGFNDKHVQLVSGSAFPMLPTKFIEKAMYEGVNIWNIARSNVRNSEMYFCEGQIRAFKRTLYKDIKFPDKSADDVYPFLYLNDVEKFRYVEEAKVYYRLPSTVKDLISQQRRYLRSMKLHTNNFSKKMISKYFVITDKDKYEATFLNIKKNSLWTVVYLIIMVLIKFDALFFNYETNAKWEILTSTK